MFSEAEIAYRIENHRRISNSRPMTCPLPEGGTEEADAPRQRAAVWRWLTHLTRTE